MKTRKLTINRETLRVLVDRDARRVAGAAIETTQCRVTILQTKIGNTCNGASCFPTCAPQ